MSETYVSVYQDWTLHETRRPSTGRGQVLPRGLSSAADKPSFASRLQMLRLNAGLTVQMLACASGVPALQVGNYERGDEMPDEATSQRLIAALRVHVPGEEGAGEGSNG